MENIIERFDISSSEILQMELETSPLTTPLNSMPTTLESNNNVQLNFINYNCLLKTIYYLCIIFTIICCSLLVVSVIYQENLYTAILAFIIVTCCTLTNILQRYNISRNVTLTLV